MKRRIMILKKLEDNYHPKDSTRRGKKDRRSGENPTEEKRKKTVRS
jgi:hypothetical protein